jgi:CheY-like chemotaxis protein
MNVFVSYQRADTALAAHALGYALRLAGHEAFVDTGSIGVGEMYRQVIGYNVARANVMLVLIGAAFDASRLGEPASVLAFEWQRACFHSIGIVPVLVEGGRMPDGDALPPELRWIRRHNALSLRRASLHADIEACVAAVPSLAVAPRRAARVLWVDDKPANNENERRWLRPHGIVFDCVVSTAEALEQLASESYDLVITDLGRKDSSDRSWSAGADFLDRPVVKDGGPPVIVYAGALAVSRRDELMQRGASEVTQNTTVLLRTVLDLLGRNTAADGAGCELSPR